MASSDPRLVLLAPEDNCVVVAQALRAGDHVIIDGRSVAVAKAIGVGHKLARHAIARGEKVLKYGAIIGTASAPIARGEHVHTHNLQSDYLPTYTLEAGRAFVGKHA
jgi:altronate dehydratase small subunit